MVRRSLARRPDELEVFPAHFEGPCGKHMCGRPSTTIGFERRFNPILQLSNDEFLKYSLAPTLASVYDEPDVQKAYPFAAELKQSVSQAKARPVSPVYPQISEAIYNNVYSALWSGTSVDSALKKAQDQINRALQTF